MTYVVRTLRDSFTPLRLPNLRTYLIGQAISLFGTWMQVTAQGWLVWELSHSEVALGIVSMLGSLPLLLFGLWAGVWVDRFDRRKILIGTQAAAMILAFILAALVWTKHGAVVARLRVEFLAGLCRRARFSRAAGLSRRSVRHDQCA